MAGASGRAEAARVRSTRLRAGAVWAPAPSPCVGGRAGAAVRARPRGEQSVNRSRRPLTPPHREGHDARVPSSDVLLPARPVFQPVVDLDTGSVIAVEAHAGPPADGRMPALADPAEADVRRAIGAAKLTTATGSRLPVQLALRAETVTRGESLLSRLHQGLHETGRRPQEVIICLAGGFPPALRSSVVAALRGLRGAGYLVGFAGFGTAHTPLDLLVDTHPYLLRLDPGLARGAPGDPRRSRLVEALVGLAHRLDTQVLAPGLNAEEQVVRLRALGVRLAQGQVLSATGWQPGMKVTVPVTDHDRPGAPRPGAELGPRVSEYTLPAVTMPEAATADEVLTTLNADPGIGGVVLVDQRQRPRASVDRTRFLLALSGAYGHALHGHKPALRLADPPRVVPRTVPAIAALRAAGHDPSRVYDDLVVTDEIGRCLGIVRVADLIRGLSP